MAAALSSKQPATRSHWSFNNQDEVMARNLSSAVVSAIVGALVAFLTCFVFFYFFYERGRADPHESNGNVAAPVPTRDQEIQNPEIKAEDVKSVSIKTVYKAFFEPGDKCAKTYDEYFGKNDGVSSMSSPCTVQITFDREGNATRSLEIRRWDRAAKDYHVVETSSSTAHISPDKFDSLAKTIVSNEAFKVYAKGMSITASNCSVTVAYGNDAKTAMSNVDEKTTVFLDMVNAFKLLEKELVWKTA
jgi:hypothetical protein